MQENPVRGIRKLKGNLFISLLLLFLLFCRLNFRPFLFLFLFFLFLGRREDFFCTVFSVVVLAFLAFIRGGPGGSGGPW